MSDEQDRDQAPWMEFAGMVVSGDPTPARRSTRQCTASLTDA